MSLNSVFIVGFLVFGFYKLVELFVRRRERIMIIERLDKDAFNEFVRNGAVMHPSLPDSGRRMKFGVLHFAAALLGLGLGIIASFTICSAFFIHNSDFPWYYRDACQSGCVLLFMGLALVISFVIEYRLAHKKEQNL